jgi:NAD(P)-dependent dehydrogenase (short-subunit alcohol dehydrogenase family)
MGLEGKVVVVTGGSAGIGAALGEEVARRGGTPVLAARRRDELEKAAARAGAAQVVVADVTRRADVERILAEALARHGRVDVWVNNAGRAISRAVSQLTDEDIDEMVLVNVKSALYGMQVAAAHFKTVGRGQIINVSSMLSRLPIAGIRSAYSAAKAALNSLTANLRMELRAEFPEIWVTNVLPGVVATDFGLNARHGGPDNRKLPNAQPVEEVAAVIADVIEVPRVDEYTRPEARGLIAAYYAAEDMGEVESRPPFVMPRR